MRAASRALTTSFENTMSGFLYANLHLCFFLV